MDVTLFATKGNLIAAKNSLKLSKQGYDLLDKKRNILIKEMMSLIEKAQDIQGEIDGKYREAYASLQRANISIGISEVEKISRCTHIEDGIDLKFRSVMGVEIPSIDYEEKKAATEYDFFTTPSSLDDAFLKFNEVKNLTIRLAEIENSVYRLASNIKKTQKRANSLKNIMIPRYEKISSDIQNVLEEKEREEFTRLKVIKNGKNKQKKANSQ